MPEDRSPPHEPGSDVRPSSKHKWRGKLFSADGRFGRSVEDIESTDNDIASFLQNAASKAATRPQPVQLAPRIDTTVTPRSPALAPPSESMTVVDVYRPPKPRQNKGLRVTFVAAPPKIIGEGGDEAELPSKDVSKSPEIAPQLGQPHTLGLPTGATEGVARRERRPSPVPVDNPTFQPKALQRAPTGLSEILGEKTLDDNEQGIKPSSRSISASPPLKLKPLPQIPDQIRNCLDINLDLGPRDAHPNISPLADQDYVSDDGRSFQAEGAMGDSTSDYLDVPSPATLAGNSITPRPSPQAPSTYLEAQPSSYQFPAPPPKTRTTPEVPYRKHEMEVQDASGHLQLPKTKAFSLRQVAKGLGDDSLDDFDARVRRFNDIFRLGVSAYSDLVAVQFVQWIRTACWWFLMGQQGLESEVRSKPDVSSHTKPSQMLKQAYVNLAKSWWIVKEITPNHPEITRFGKAGMNSLCAMIKSFGDETLAELVEVHVSIVANMRALTMSMKRNGKLPPTDLEIQRLDLHVLLELPQLPPDLALRMVNNGFESPAKGHNIIADPFFPIPVGDTKRHFNFCRMFVEVSAPLGESRQGLRVPCVLSVLRHRNEWGVQATVASQDGQVNLVISDEVNGALPWKSVQWRVQSHVILLTISTDPAASTKSQIQFTEKDFKTLWGICDYTQRIKKDISIRKDEKLIFERTLRRFQCEDATHFPVDSIANCRLLVFEKRCAFPERPERRTVHNGFRLTVTTPSSLKTLSIVNYDLGRENPILFGIHRGNEGSRLMLRILPSSVRITPIFAKTEDIDAFRHLLSGTLTTKEDNYFPSLQLQSLVINENSMINHMGSEDNRGTAKISWNKLRIVRKGPASHTHDPVSTGLENLRILADSDFGTLADRINLMPGELQLGLSIDTFNEIQLLRPPRSDMTWSLADERVPKEMLNSICVTLKTMLTSTTIRRYSFRSLQDLHSFQNIVTGFSVLFDGLAGNFAISRRRMVVPVHKKWEASSARLQVLKHDKTVQLVGFFKDFSHGTCINFVLKVTDVFETFEKGEWFYLRIVDAKFPLPKRPDDETKDFVCLDTPEYPSEHDDITIGFDNEHDRERFREALPGPVNKMSKMASLRR